MIWSSASKIETYPPPGYRLLQEGRRKILVQGGCEDHLRHQGLLDPAGLWKKTRPSARMMGRGEVLLIESQTEMAIRKYRHGGLLRRLTGDLFLFGSRPFKELEVTQKARSVGIPSLEILAAIVERGWGGWYKGYLITRYLPEAMDLIRYIAQRPEGTRRPETIEKAGEVVRRMHQGGIYHADLHLKNFLVEEGEEVKVYLIDFDRSTIHAHLRPSQRMKNLKRLDRSAEKLSGEGLPLTKRDKGLFCRAYAMADDEIRPFIRAYLNSYRWYRIIYRWGWWIARVFYPSQRSRRKPST